MRFLPPEGILAGAAVQAGAWGSIKQTPLQGCSWELAASLYCDRWQLRMQPDAAVGGTRASAFPLSRR